MLHVQMSRAFSVLVVALASMSAAPGQTIELVSRAVGGGPANGASEPIAPSWPGATSADAVATSADGRFVAFTSAASNLTPIDTNGSVRDVFVFDRATQSTELVSVWGAGLQGVTSARGAALSDDGRYVAFVSDSVMPADPDPFAPDLLVRDRLNGTTVELTPTETNPWEVFTFSSPPQMSADGRYVAIQYARLNVTFLFTYLRVWDRTTGAVVWEVVNFEDFNTSWSTSVGGFELAKSGLWLTYTESFSGFGTHSSSLFRSAVPSAPNGTSSFLERNDASALTLGISASGRYIAYRYAPNGADRELRLFDIQSGSDEHLDVTLNGAPLGAGASEFAGVSDDGRRVAFVSASSQFVVGDTNGAADLFVRDRLTQSTWRASLDAGGAQASGATSFGALQPDGAAVVFSSSAANLVAGDSNGVADVFRRELWGLDGGSYCTSTTSANGCTGEISAIGSPSAGQPAGYTVRVDGVDGQRSGLIFYGASSASTPFAPAHPSTMCVSAPRQRTDVANSGGTAGACDGAFALDVLAWAASHPGALLTPLVAGQSMCFQGWIREPSFTPATLLTDAWWVTLGL